MNIFYKLMSIPMLFYESDKVITKKRKENDYSVKKDIF